MFSSFLRTANFGSAVFSSLPSSVSTCSVSCKVFIIIDILLKLIARTLYKFCVVSSSASIGAPFIRLNPAIYDGLGSVNSNSNVLSKLSFKSKRCDLYPDLFIISMNCSSVQFSSSSVSIFLSNIFNKRFLSGFIS